MKNILNKTIWFFIVFSVYVNSNAQVTRDLPNYFPVSPNAASFAKQGFYPVDYSTGKLNVDVPIYTIKTKELSVPITVSYNTSGIQLNETASWVGLGWNLNAGGAIVRNIKGKPDQAGIIPDFRGVLAFNEVNYKSLCRQERGEDDTAPDEFIISAPGLSGSFYFDHTDSNKVLFRDFQNTKVVELRDQYQQILSFTLIKDDGTVYVFGTNNNVEITQNVEDANGFSYLNYKTNSSYYLSEIISANGQEKIKFNYRSIDSYDYPVVSSESLVAASKYSYIETNFPKKMVTVKKKFLESIVFANGKINFLSSLDREDLGLDCKLNFIEVYASVNNQNRLIQKNSFIYDYYLRAGGVTTSDPNSFDPLKNYVLVGNSKNRSLRLKEIVNNNVNTRYSFEYNNNALPVRGSNAQDYWGYINNNTGSLTVPTVMDLHSQTGNALLISFGTGDRNSNEDKMKSGILEKVRYPEGGYATFEYEANRFTENVNVPTIVQKSASAVAYGTGCNSNYGSSSKTFGFSIGSNYVQGSGQLSIFFSPASQEAGGTTNVKFDAENFIRPLPFTSGGSSVVPKDFITGSHTLSSSEFRSGNIGVYGCPWTSIMASWKENNGFTIVPTVKLVGGLRIKSIKTFMGNTSLPATRKDYVYQQENVLVKAGVGCYKRNVITTGGDQVTPVCSSSSIFNNNIGGGPTITYGLVTEIEKDPKTLAENGKTEYYFQNVAAERVIDNIPTVFKHPSFISSYPYVPLTLGFFGFVGDFTYYKNDLWNYGSLLKTKIYKRDASNVLKLITSTENQYSVLKSKILPYNLVFNIFPDYTSNGYGEFSVFPKNGVYWQGGDFSSYQFFYFSAGVSVGKKVKIKTINTEYNSSEVPTIITTTNYYYDNPVHNQVTRTESINSIGETVKTKLSYPQDLIVSGQSAEMQKMTNQNRIDKAIKTETFINNIQITETITKYEQNITTGNLLLPKEIHSVKGTNEAFPFNNNNRKVNYSLYDTDIVAGMPNGNGNVLEYRIENDAPISIIWGYNKTQPIAKIENATYASVTSNLITAAQTASDTGTEASLLTALTNLRNALPNAMVTTYTYIPLVGVSTITDPKGDKITYTYDSFGRLQFVKDKNGNILSENQYNYKQ